jgi:hypothetical protein
MQEIEPVGRTISVVGYPVDKSDSPMEQAAESGTLKATYRG